MDSNDQWTVFISGFLFCHYIHNKIYNVTKQQTGLQQHTQGQEVQQSQNGAEQETQIYQFGRESNHEKDDILTDNRAENLRHAVPVQQQLPDRDQTQLSVQSIQVQQKDYSVTQMVDDIFSSVRQKQSESYSAQHQSKLLREQDSQPMQINYNVSAIEQLMDSMIADVYLAQNEVEKMGDALFQRHDAASNQEVYQHKQTRSLDEQQLQQRGSFVAAENAQNVTIQDNYSLTLNHYMHACDSHEPDTAGTLSSDQVLAKGGVEGAVPVIPPSPTSPISNQSQAEGVVSVNPPSPIPSISNQFESNVTHIGGQEKAVVQYNGDEDKVEEEEEVEEFSTCSGNLAEGFAMLLNEICLMSDDEQYDNDENDNYAYLDASSDPLFYQQYGQFTVEEQPVQGQGKEDDNVTYATKFNTKNGQHPAIQSTADVTDATDVTLTPVDVDVTPKSPQPRQSSQTPEQSAESQVLCGLVSAYSIQLLQEQQLTKNTPAQQQITYKASTEQDNDDNEHPKRWRSCSIQVQNVDGSQPEADGSLISNNFNKAGQQGNEEESNQPDSWRQKVSELSLNKERVSAHNASEKYPLSDNIQTYQQSTWSQSQLEQQQQQLQQQVVYDLTIPLHPISVVQSTKQPQIQERYHTQEEGTQQEPFEAASQFEHLQLSTDEHPNDLNRQSMYQTNLCEEQQYLQENLLISQSCNSQADKENRTIKDNGNRPKTSENQVQSAPVITICRTPSNSNEKVARIPSSYDLGKRQATLFQTWDLAPEKKVRNPLLVNQYKHIRKSQKSCTRKSVNRIIKETSDSVYPSSVLQQFVMHSIRDEGEEAPIEERQQKKGHIEQQGHIDTSQNSVSCVRSGIKRRAEPVSSEQLPPAIKKVKLPDNSLQSNETSDKSCEQQQTSNADKKAGKRKSKDQTSTGQNEEKSSRKRRSIRDNCEHNKQKKLIDDQPLSARLKQIKMSPVLISEITQIRQRRGNRRARYFLRDQNVLEQNTKEFLDLYYYAQDTTTTATEEENSAKGFQSADESVDKAKEVRKEKRMRSKRDEPPYKQISVRTDINGNKPPSICRLGSRRYNELSNHVSETEELEKSRQVFVGGAADGQVQTKRLKQAFKQLERNETDKMEQDVEIPVRQLRSRSIDLVPTSSNSSKH